jgi:hypothetical protein
MSIDKEKAEAEAKAAAEKKKKDEEEKKKKAKEPKLKFYFDVKVEVMLPATLTYKVLAEDAQQAVNLIKGMQPHSVNHKLIGRKELRLKVYDTGGSMIRFIKELFGR